MKWVKRGLWLVAWSAWAWCGFGLYRELPRNLGPVVCQLPFGGHENAMAFIDGKDELVAHDRGDGRPFWNRSFVNVYDAKTGERLRSFKVNWSYGWENEACLRRGLLFASRYGHNNPMLEVLDLATGDWTSVAGQAAKFVALHPSKPWAVISDPQGGDAGEGRLFVVDVRTGKELFLRPFLAERRATGTAMFAPEGDRLIVGAVAAELSQHSPTHAEVWRLGPAPQLERVIELSQGGSEVMDVAGGRMATAGIYGGGSFDVFDLESGMRVLWEPASMHAFGPGIFLDATFLSADGRIVLGGIPKRLQEIESERVLWTESANETIRPGKRNNSFSVDEHWVVPVVDYALKNFDTIAERDLNSGRLLRRFWKKDQPSHALRSSDGTMAADVNGAVRRMELRINGEALACCQAVLALPLVLVWAGLRWRRYRRVRERRAVS